MTPKKKIWVDEDFDELGWNNTRLYGLLLPGRKHQFSMFIDYAIRTPLSDPDFGKWELVPVELTFYNVVGLKIEFDTKNFSETDIVNLRRSAGRSTPDGNSQYWDYIVDLSTGGFIMFSATSMRQAAQTAPQISGSYDLDREMTFHE